MRQGPLKMALIAMLMALPLAMGAGSAILPHITQLWRSILDEDTVKLQALTDSNAFVQVLDADGGTPIFTVNTDDEQVHIGLNTKIDATKLLYLTKETTGASQVLDLINPATSGSARGTRITFSRGADDSGNLSEKARIEASSVDSTFNAGGSLIFATRTDGSPSNPSPKATLSSEGVFTLHSGKLDATAGSVQIKRSTSNISNPPDDSEIDAAFGNPSTVGEGFIGIMDDNDAGSNVYLVAATGTDADRWWICTMTQAAVGAASHLLLEDGSSFLLLEDGTSKLKLESSP